MWQEIPCTETWRPLCKAIKMNLGLFWRPQDVEDARSMGDLPKSIIYTEKGTSIREVLRVNKAGRSWISKKPSKPFDVTHTSTGFGISPAGVWSFWFSISYVLIPPFWNKHVYILCHCRLELYDLFLILQLQLKDFLESQKRCRLKQCWDYKRLKTFRWIKCILHYDMAKPMGAGSSMWCLRTHPLIHVNTWSLSPVGGTAWEALECLALEEVCHCG